MIPFDCHTVGARCGAISIVAAAAAAAARRGAAPLTTAARFFALAGAFALAAVWPVQAQQGAATTAGTLGAWMNPDIGFVYDLKTDLHDAERDDAGDALWTTRGFELSTAELSLGAEVDPYARIDFNAMFSKTGAEVHELFFDFPALPGNLALKGGHFLANFGRWSQFHAHAMPFSSEPRILHEYLGGHLAPTGLELSFLVPLPHFVEVTGGLYNAIDGHSHDTDPTAAGTAWGPDNPPPGCHFHGDEIHCPGHPELEEAYLASLTDPEAPTLNKTNREWRDLAYLGRVASSLELDLSWSIDFGASVIHQDRYSHSQRFPDTAYAKTTYGADVTVFWTPPEQNLYRGLDFGIEFVANDQQFEIEDDEQYLRRTFSRSGAFAYARYRASRSWSGGVFGESFQPNQGDAQRRKRFGAFATYNISHFQYVRLEFSRDERVPGHDAVHRFVLQYDGVIGYHTHGRQR